MVTPHQRRHWQGLAVLVLAAFALCLYAYFIPTAPGGHDLLEAGLFQGLGNIHPELPGYALRFTASALILGLFPLLGMLIIGSLLNYPSSRKINTPKASGGLWLNSFFSLQGFCRPRMGLFFWKPFLPIWAGFILIGIFGAFDTKLAAFYPYSQYLTVLNPGVRFFLLHALLYALFYYLPWELFFRGIMILPFLRLFDRKNNLPFLMCIASIQVIPSSLLHFGHPLSESLGAVLFGVLAAYTVLHYRSIWPSFILHVSTGLALDLSLTLRSLL